VIREITMKVQVRACSGSVLQVGKLLCVLLVAANFGLAAEKARVYPMGEEDPGIALGEFVITTDDIEAGPTVNAGGQPVSDGAGLFVPLDSFSDESAPKYVQGRTGPGSIAIAFDGVNDQLSAAVFDPRNFDPATGWQFNTLSQAWVWADPAGNGREQVIWQVGPDNGSAAISDTGFWKLIAGGTAIDAISDVPVAFGEWTHLAIFRGGNDGRLYVNGQLSALSGGFWNVTGPQFVGSSIGSDRFFHGIIDDFNIAGFADRSFVLSEDLDIFEGLLTGVPGDINQDHVADILDYQEWSKHVGFNNNLGAGDPFTLMMGDLDQNGRVNYFDFELLKEITANNGNPLPLEAIPEPAAAALAATALLLLAGFVRRSR
jgi:hypothetical protein